MGDLDAYDEVHESYPTEDLFPKQADEAFIYSMGNLQYIKLENRSLPPHLLQPHHLNFQLAGALVARLSAGLQLLLLLSRGILVVLVMGQVPFVEVLHLLIPLLLRWDRELILPQLSQVLNLLVCHLELVQ